MAAQTRLLQLAIAAVNLVIVGLVFTSVWPFPSGQFKVDLPSVNEVRWTYQDGIVHVTAPYSIDNGGFYDVRELSLGYSVTNDSGYLLADSVIIIGDVPAGQVTSDSIDFSFDIMRLYNDGATWMVFNDDLLKFVVEVSCYYTMKLVKFEASYQVQVPWEALIVDFGVADYTWGTASTPLGDVPDSLNVTCWLDTADILEPLTASAIHVELRGNQTHLGGADANIALGGNHTVPLRFSIDGTALLSVDPNATLYVDLRVMVAGFSDSRTYEIGNLQGLMP